MALLKLPVEQDNLPAFTFQIDLDGSTFELGFRWNERTQRWYMDIKDTQENDLLLGIPLLTEVDIISRFKDPALPAGRMFLVDITGERKNPTYYTLGSDVILFYDEAG